MKRSVPSGARDATGERATGDGPTGESLAGNTGESRPGLDASASVRSERLPFAVDPERVFAEVFAAEPCAFWLDAGISAPEGMSYLGAASPTRPSYVVAKNRLHALRQGKTVPVTGCLEDALRAWRVDADGETADSPLGWVGWLGYEYGARRLEVPTEASPYPDAAMLAADRVLAVDHATGESRLWFIDDADGRAWADSLRDRLHTLEPARMELLETKPQGAEFGAVLHDRSDDIRWRHSRDAYLRMIAACQEAIGAGDAYLLCLTNQVAVRTEAEPLEVYRRLRRDSLAAHGGFVQVDGVAVLSASPELFLLVGDGVASTRPVKGTRPRGATAEEDATLHDELRTDEKERAENLMIVDLMRNDLARIAGLGGVTVTELLAVETHAHVHQLVSTVQAELAPGIDALDVIDTCFPAGSMTGAPKLSAMGILHELEQGPRGIYSGCLGRIGLDGSAELAMVIRSIVMSEGKATIGTGGGITALSVPQNEFAEIELKAAALLAVLDG